MSETSPVTPTAPAPGAQSERAWKRLIWTSEIDTRLARFDAGRESARPWPARSYERTSRAWLPGPSTLSESRA